MTHEQYERWHLRDCVRCGRHAAKSANWEGPICRTCYDRALKIRGTCPGCGQDRLLPGRNDAGEAIWAVPDLVEQLRGSVAGVSSNGVLGNPTRANSDDGERILQRWTDALIAQVTDWRSM